MPLFSHNSKITPPPAPAIYQEKLTSAGHFLRNKLYIPVTHRLAELSPADRLSQVYTSLKKNHKNEVAWLAARKWRLALKTVILCLCVAGCVYQMIFILNLFFSFPTIVFVHVKTMDKLFLPGITLCNGNRFMMSKLQSFNQTFNTLWNQTMEEDIDEGDRKLKQQRIIDETTRSLMDSVPVSELLKFGHLLDDFIDPNFFKCATDAFNKKIKCKNHANVYTTVQEIGNCFTLFHRGGTSAHLKAIAIDSGLSQSPVIRGGDGSSVDIESADRPFHPNEVLRLKITFQEDEYTILNEPVSGLFIFHDDNEAPSVREKNFVIEPGHYYEFYLLKQSDQLLPAPYSTDCVEYDDGTSDDEVSYLRRPMSKADCVIGCMAANTIDKCNCWPPELPFIKSTDPRANENRIKWCDWIKGPEFSIEKPVNVTWFGYCFVGNEHECAKKCKSDCRSERYSAIVQAKKWPSDQRIEHSTKADFFKEQQKCCAIVSVRYWSAESTVHQYQPRFELVEFISYIGGLVSMWLGFSLIRSYSIGETVTVYLWNHVINKQEQETTSTAVKPLSSEGSLQRRQFWQRKARIASIMMKMNPTQHRNTNRRPSNQRKA